jgi:hypothetical protein
VTFFSQGDNITMDRFLSNKNSEGNSSSSYRRSSDHIRRSLNSPFKELDSQKQLEFFKDIESLGQSDLKKRHQLF